MAGEGTRKKGRRKEGLSKGEKRRLRQLVVCLILFGLVFLGRGLDLGPMARLSSAVGDLVQRDTDFQAVFAQMGESFSKGEPAVETFRSFWSGVFPGEETEGEAIPHEGTAAPEEQGQTGEGGEDGEETGT